MGGPLEELHDRHQFRPHPDALLHLRRGGLGTVSRRQRLSFVHESKSRRFLVSRRSFFGGIAGLSLSGCVSRAQSDDSFRLRSRPGKNSSTLAPGVHPLGIRAERDAILYIPTSLKTDQPSPLLVYVHGAGGPRQSEKERMTKAADEHAFILLSPSSEGATWDAIRGEYGADVRVIDKALARTFSACRIDPRRIALSGFSDGATYALGLGLSNSDFFKSVLAFSPGFIPAGSKVNGSPRIFISHGTNDNILPIDSCSRRLVPQLKREGLAITYREFEGPHTVPPNVLTEAMEWFLAS
jgi:phospholipase/carboxylesterase